MDHNNLEYQRRCAVSKAWLKERQQVMNSCGSRNWTQKEQKEILSTGKCHGYEGQHMLSVKAHPEYAGNEKNIQFLTHAEHFQAHNGNWKNDTNGKYNVHTGKVEPFPDGVPSVRYRKLSDPISDRDRKIAASQYPKMNNMQQDGMESSGDKEPSRSESPVGKSKSVSDKNQSKESQCRNLFNSKINAAHNQTDKESNAVHGIRTGNSEYQGRGQER